VHGVEGGEVRPGIDPRVPDLARAALARRTRDEVDHPVGVDVAGGGQGPAEVVVLGVAEHGPQGEGAGTADDAHRSRAGSRGPVAGDPEQEVVVTVAVHVGEDRHRAAELRPRGGALQGEERRLGKEGRGEEGRDDREGAHAW
jgi:hypothetical protein